MIAIGFGIGIDKPFRLGAKLKQWIIPITGQSSGTPTAGTSINKSLSAGASIVLNLTAATTLTITEVYDGAIGTILVNQDAIGSRTLGLQFFTNNYLNELTKVTIGTNTGISSSANKHSLITFKRYGDKVTLIYGHEQ